MTSSKKKCKGCGVELSTNPSDLGYCNDLKSDYCQRCFRIINYNDDIIKDKSAIIAKSNLDKLSINDDDLLFVVLDWTDLDNTLLEDFKDHEKTIYLVNKIDLLQKDFNLEFFKERIKQYLLFKGYQYTNVILTSSKRNQGIKTINELIKRSPLKQKYYFLGKTNVGKSSIINAILKESHTIIPKITTSQFANTTLNFRKIKIHKHDIIDCPGYNNHNSLSHLADLHNLKLSPVKNNKVKNFQIKGRCLLFIEKLAVLELTNSHNLVGSVTVYPNYEFDYHKTSPNNYDRIINNNQILTKQIDPNYSEVIFDSLKTKNNLVISGLGVVVLKNIDKVKLLINKDINCYLLEEEIL